MCLLYKSYENTFGKGEIAHIEQFLAPLAEGHWAIVMALCPLSVHACLRP